MRQIKSIPKYGTKSADVKIIQEQLNSIAKAKLLAEGNFGPKTKAAIQKFQKANGLAGSGILGPKTIKLLGIEIATPVFPQVEGTPEFARTAWDSLRFDDGTASIVEGAAKLVLKGKARYESVVAKLATGMPWYVLGAIHYKEGSCDFKRILHNGEKLTDVNERGTILVPKGRGKGKNWTWEDAALDALTIESLGKNKNWELGQMFVVVEKYNGTGYINGKGKNQVTPYLYSCTNVALDKGIYVSDGSYDENANANGSAGFAAILKWLEINGHIKVQRQPLVVEAPKVVKTLKEEIIERVLAKCKADIDSKLRETNGKNRSPKIDTFNRRVGTYMGAPYCASSLWCNFKDVCIELGLNFPMPATASSQALRYNAPEKYRKSSKGKRGDLAIYQQKKNASHGHAMILCKDQEGIKFETYEYNTDADGSRDGDGAYHKKTRTTEGNSTMNFTKFIDLAQWIVDVN